MKERRDGNEAAVRLGLVIVVVVALVGVAFCSWRW